MLSGDATYFFIFLFVSFPPFSLSFFVDVVVAAAAAVNSFLFHVFFFYY